MFLPLTWTDHLDQFTQHRGYFDLLVDWKALSSSNTLLAWRNVKPKFAVRYISTFAKSVKIASKKLNSYVLLNPDEVDSSKHNWPSF